MKSRFKNDADYGDVWFSCSIVSFAFRLLLVLVLFLVLFEKFYRIMRGETRRNYTIFWRHRRHCILKFLECRLDMVHVSTTAVKGSDHNDFRIYNAAHSLEPPCQDTYNPAILTTITTHLKSWGFRVRLSPLPSKGDDPGWHVL